MFQDHILILHPFLQGEVLDVDVPTSLHWATGICHHYGRRIVFIYVCGIFLVEAEFIEDSSEVLYHFCGCDSNQELGFRRATAYGRYPFGPIGHSGSGKAEHEGPDGPTCADTIRMCRIDICTQCRYTGRVGQTLVCKFHGSKEYKRDVWEMVQWFGAPEYQAVITSLSEILEDPLEGIIMTCCWTDG
jgi:hypothetical protein